MTLPSPRQLRAQSITGSQHSTTLSPVQPIHKSTLFQQYEPIQTWTDVTDSMAKSQQTASLSRPRWRSYICLWAVACPSLRFRLTRTHPPPCGGFHACATSAIGGGASPMADTPPWLLSPGLCPLPLERLRAESIAGPEHRATFDHYVLLKRLKATVQRG